MDAIVKSATGREVESLTSRLRVLYDDYAACIDDIDLKRWPNFFTNDALYRVTSRANYDKSLAFSEIYCDGIGMIHDRAAAILETTVYAIRPFRHFISGVRVLAIEGSQIRAQANFVILEAPQDTEPRVLMFGRYLDRLVEADNALLFGERCCVYDNYRINTSLLFPI